MLGGGGVRRLPSIGSGTANSTKRVWRFPKCGPACGVPTGRAAYIWIQPACAPRDSHGWSCVAWRHARRAVALLASCYRTALDLARQPRLASIAFAPSISCGVLTVYPASMRLRRSPVRGDARGPKPNSDRILPRRPRYRATMSAPLLPQASHNTPDRPTLHSSPDHPGTMAGGADTPALVCRACPRQGGPAPARSPTDLSHSRYRRDVRRGPRPNTASVFGINLFVPEGAFAWMTSQLVPANRSCWRVSNDGCFGLARVRSRRRPAARDFDAQLDAGAGRWRASHSALRSACCLRPQCGK
jgi:hypothetical protein